MAFIRLSKRASVRKSVTSFDATVSVRFET